MNSETAFELERKFCGAETKLSLVEGKQIEGYASYFGLRDRGGDSVAKGAYSKSLDRMNKSGGKIKMLWQHDPAQPIGIWDEVREDERGLFVKGRLLLELERGREAAHMIEAGIIDGLSIGYRTLRADRDQKGVRHLREIDLWEVSLVTFPMLPEARVSAKADENQDVVLREVAALLRDAGQMLSRG